MTQTLNILRAGPGITVQDLGRPGWQARGQSCGGAVDRRALFEAAALLGLPSPTACLEMMGLGGTFTVTAPTRIALTGALMQASIDGAPAAWNRSHVLDVGQKLVIGGAQAGVYGYLSFAGGITIPAVMDSRATHLTAGMGRFLRDGDKLPLGDDPDPTAVATHLPIDNRFAGGEVRVMPGPQTDYFAKDMRDRFFDTAFLRSPRGNRQGVRLDHDGGGFSTRDQANIASDLILPGDLQMTGNGTPYVLLSECQTIGGYPRIGTVIPADLPRIAQAMPGAALHFRLITVEEADATARSPHKQLQSLKESLIPLIRDPHDIGDLLAYQLISGVTPGDDLERP